MLVRHLYILAKRKRWGKHGDETKRRVRPFTRDIGAHSRKVHDQLDARNASARWFQISLILDPMLYDSYEALTKS